MSARTPDGKFEPLGAVLMREVREQDRADARAWRRFQASGLLTRLWLAVRA